MANEQKSAAEEAAGRFEPGRLLRSYIAALSLIAVFLTLSHTMSVMALDAARFDASIINISGRQRMLSQRILYLSLEELEHPSEEVRDSLASAVDTFSTVHAQLSTMAKASPVLEQAYFADWKEGDSLDTIARDFIKDATEIAKEEVDQTAGLVDTMAHLSWLGTDQLLARLEHAVQAHETVARNNSNRMKWMENVSLVAAGVVLLLEALFIFWPTHRQMRRAFAQLEEANASKDNAIKRLVRYSEISADLFWETDTEGRVTYISGRLLPDISFEDDPFVGQPYTSILGFGPGEQGAMKQALATQRPYEGILADFSDHKGRRYKISLTGRPSFDADGHLTGYVGVGDDVTEEFVEQERIRSQAEKDSLTGLYNRHAFNQRLNRQMLISLPSGKSLSMLAMDLDGFKAVNDKHGHDVGDALLKQVADRIRQVVGPRGWTSRLGGDEFTVVCKGDLSDNALAALAVELNQALAEPFAAGLLSLSIGVSVGIAVAPRDARTVHELTKCADVALYEAKRAGRSCHRIFDPAMTADSDRLMQIKAGLRQALRENAINIAFLPIIEFETQAISGFEALARWKHPELGVVPPDEFVSIAESGGFMPELGQLVLRKACRAAASWPSDLSGPARRVSVNIGAANFFEAEFVRKVSAILAESGLAPSRLELDITNSLMLDQSENAINAMHALKDMGVQIAIDDFGNGKTSLSQLRMLPLSRIKIDRTFISEMTHDSSSMKIIRGMIRLAGDLGLSVLAEGVETERQAALLIAAGCREAQGHFFSKALRESDVRRLLAGQAPSQLAS